MMGKMREYRCKTCGRLIIRTTSFKKAMKKMKAHKDRAHPGWRKRAARKTKDKRKKTSAKTSRSRGLTKRQRDEVIEILIAEGLI